MKVAARIVIALVCSLLLWEVLLRVTIIRPVPYHSDPVFGWMPRPHSSGMQNTEGYSVMHYNAQGFREAEIEPRAHGELRILALGDSFTEGRQMMADETFPHRLQTLLKSTTDCSGQNIRVFNGGRDGTSPAYSAYQADALQKLFQPDWVVFLMRDGDWDQVMNKEKEIFYRTADAAGYTGFSFETKWQSERQSRVRRLLKTLHLTDTALYNYTQSKLALLRGTTKRDYDHAAHGDKKQLSAEESLRESTLLSLQKHAQEWTLDQLKARYKARILVLHIPYGSTSAGGLVPPTELEGALETACRNRDIPFISLRKPIVDDFARTAQAPYGFANTSPWSGHPNAHGHEIIARTLADFFAKRLCSPATTGTAATNKP